MSEHGSLNDIREDPSQPSFLTGGGTMGSLMRGLDWAETPLGPVEGWPQSLRSALSICLGANYPIAIYWGPELALLYNDAWSLIPGDKHPWALGRAGREVWPEIWDRIGPLYDKVQSTGEGVWQQDQLLPMQRHGYTEECYFNFTFSPIRGADGRVEGIFNAVVETTFRVIGERRERTLRTLAEGLAAARSEDEVFANAAGLLAADADDIPFCLLYRINGEGGYAHLTGAAGLPTESPAAPPRIDRDSEQAAWPLFAAETTGSHLVTGLAERFGAPMPGGSWPEAGSQALIVPIKAGSASAAGLLIAGISPRRALDDDYRAFITRAAGHVATAVSNARVYAEERRRAEALADIDKAKTAFFSNVSHEFRTPLALMLGPLDDVLSGDGITRDARGQLEVARRNGARLLQLVNSLLDFSRLEAGRATATYQATDLCAFTAEIASTFRSAFDKAGLGLDIGCDTLGEPVFLDRDLWEKALLNLISNAFKFTLQGRVRISLARSQDGGAAIIEVSDTGIGIPEPELPKLFDRFHRVEGARGRSFEGSGIGLALVQEVIKLHGGDIAVRSVIDEGTTFTVKLPFGSSHLPADKVQTEQAEAPQVARARAFVEEALQWLPPSADGSTSVPRNGKTVLLADDNPDMRSYIRRLLEANGYAVDAADDGEAALSSARNKRPDLILSDVMMPKLDGFGLLKAVRQDRMLADLPVVLLSARAGAEAQAEGLEAGADDYLVKPFIAGELLARINANIRMADVRRGLNDALRESEARFRVMADNAPVMMWVTEEDGTCTYLNRKWYEFTGQTESEALGTGWLDAVHPDDKGWSQEEFQKANAARRPFQLEYRLRKADGTYRWAIDAAAPRLEAGLFRGYIGSVIDIEDRKSTELALGEQAVALKALGEAAAAISGDLDLERIVQTVTDAGVTVSGAQFGAFFYNVVAEDGESYMLYTLSGVPRSAFEKFPMPRNTEVFAPTFGGTGIMRSDDITKDPRYGKSSPHFGMPKGHLPVRSYLALPVKSRNGDVIGGLFFGHPDTGVFSALAEERLVGLAAQAAVAVDNARLFRERLRAQEELQTLNATLAARVATEVAERAKAEEALRQAQKMEAVGQLTGGIAHDFNNLLTIIIGGLDTIRRAKSDDHVRIRRSADMALQGAQRAASLTSRLLAFSRRQPLTPKTLDLNGLVRDMTELLHRTLGEHIELEGVLAPRLWTIEADHNQVESAILNLAVNARDAMLEGGKLTIETANTDLDERYAETATEVIPGQYVAISISDTGEGIPKEILPRVFEPFYTTKEVGKGTGLGLSIVYGFVKQSGGHVTIYSEAGLGTTVKLYFPRHHGGEAAEAPAETTVPSSSEGEIVLVVEDNEDVRTYSVMILNEMGYHVLEAPDADAGLAIIKADQRIDLLFTDVVLPGKSGKVLAEEALQIRPDLKVLFTTGYSRNAIIHHGRVDPGVELLSKPFTFEQLAARVRDVIDRPRR